MLSHLIDIPTSILPVGGIRWTLSWIFLLSAAYTYFINHLSRDPEAAVRNEPEAERKRQYFARLRHLQSERRAFNEKRRRIVEAGSFRIFSLPPEIALLILAHAADWPSTYLSLVQVSSRCQWITFHACLPHMPIRLITPEQVRSFDSFIRTSQQIAPLIRYVWVTPLKEASLDAAVGIMRKCTNLRALATNAYLIQEGITLRGGGTRLSHPECKDLTLLSTKTQVWSDLLGTANGAAFFCQLTRLRLIGDRVPVNIPLPNLTQLSYGTSGGSEGTEQSPRVGLEMFDDQELYPALQAVIFTKPRGNAGGLRVSRPVTKRRLFMLEFPPTNTELEIWCDNASGRGIWELCACPPVQSK